MKYGEEYFNFCKDQNGFDMAVNGEWQKKYAEFVLSVFPDAKTEKCLDFGCAMGSNVVSFCDLGVDMVGIDVSEWYVQNSPFAKTGKIMSYDGDRLPFEDGHFGFIHCSQVLEHIPEENIIPIMKELLRVLKPHGILYFSTPGELLPGSVDHDPTHISCFSDEKWERLMLEAGFGSITAAKKLLWDQEPMFKEYQWHQFVGVKPTKLDVTMSAPIDQTIQPATKKIRRKK